MAPGGVLEVDNAHGPVELWVTRVLSLHGELQDRVLEPTVLLAYGAAAAVRLTTAFRGTLLAPHATVTLAKTESPHVGSFFGRRVIVEDGAHVLQAGFTRWRPLAPQLDLVCKECVTKALSAARASCREVTSIASAGTAHPASVAALEYRYSACVMNAQASIAQCELQNRWRAGVCGESGEPAAVDLSCSAR